MASQSDWTEVKVQLDKDFQRVSRLVDRIRVLEGEVAGLLRTVPLPEKVESEGGSHRRSTIQEARIRVLEGEVKDLNGAIESLDDAVWDLEDLLVGKESREVDLMNEVERLRIDLSMAEGVTVHCQEKVASFERQEEALCDGDLSTWTPPKDYYMSTWKMCQDLSFPWLITYTAKYRKR